MSTFGDFEPDDAFDTAPPDPEQVARKVHQLRQLNGFEVRSWEILSAPERVALIVIAGALLDWLRRQGALR